MNNVLFSFKPSPRQQLFWYTLLATTALAFSLKSLFFSPWPQAPELSSELILSTLKTGGFTPRSQDTLPPFRSFDLSTSPFLRYSLVNDYDLRVVVVVTRDRESFTIENINNKNKEFTLKDPRPAVDALFPTLEGMINERPALQTCQLRSPNSDPTYEVSSYQLPLRIDDYDNLNVDPFSQIIGLQPSRTYRCTLITLVSATERPIPMRDWNQLLSATSTVFLP
jgi:hypothetical protein